MPCFASARLSRKARGRPAVVEIKDGQATLWTGSQKPHYARDGIAAMLGMPVENVRAIWVPGPGSYGRNDAGDAAMDAAVLAKTVGRPVRVQYTRAQATGWDPKGPASIHRARAAIDASGNVVAYEFTSKGFSRLDVFSREGKPPDTLAGQLMGVTIRSGDAFRVPEESYEFANKRLAWETIAPLLGRASPLRTSHLRDPVGPQVHFASESFMDEVAAALGLDPIAFRLRHVKAGRDIAVIKAAAEKAGWQARPSPRKDQTGNTVSGRGIAYAQRSGTRVAVVAEVDVDRAGGKIWARKFTVAHDCGQIINPDGLKHTIEGNIVQGVSRTLWEEVKFDANNVTSVDWMTYPILDIAQAPETIDVVLINHPEVLPSGAGEPSTRPVAAAIANAIFDATGVRMRRVPFSPDRVSPHTRGSSGTHHGRMCAGGAARGIGRRHGGDARVDPPRRQRLASHRAADVEPTGRPAHRRGLRGGDRDLRGEPRRIRPGAALHRGRHVGRDSGEGRDLPGTARRLPGGGEGRSLHAAARAARLRRARASQGLEGHR